MNLNELIEKDKKGDIYFFTFDYEGTIHREDKERNEGSHYGPSCLKRFLYNYGILENKIKIIDLGQVIKPEKKYHKKYQNIKSIINFEDYLEKHKIFLKNKYQIYDGLILNMSSTRETLINYLNIINSNNDNTLLISIDPFSLVKELYDNMISPHSIVKKYLNNNNNLKIINFGLEEKIMKKSEKKYLENEVFLENIYIDYLKNLVNIENKKNKIDKDVLNDYINNKISYDSFINYSKFEKKETKISLEFKKIVNTYLNNFDNVIIHFSFDSINNSYFKGQNYKNIEGGFNNKEVIEIFKYLGKIKNKIKGIHISDFNPFEEDFISGYFYSELIYNLLDNISISKNK